MTDAIVRTGRLIQVTLPHATFGVILADGKVTHAPPIARWAIGRSEQEVAGYFKRRGAKFTVVPP